MLQLERDDVQFARRRLPPVFRKIQTDYHLAGGCLRSIFAGEEPNDFDVYPRRTGDIEPLCAEIERQGYKEAARTQHAVTFTQSGEVPIQVITRWVHVRAADLLTAFDFTCVQACLYRTCDTWLGAHAPRFFPDLAAKRLVYTGSAEPGGSLIRAQKYLRRGFSMPLDSLARLVADVHKHASAARAPILRILREVDPSNIITTDTGDDE